MVSEAIRPDEIIKSEYVDRKEKKLEEKRAEVSNGKRYGCEKVKELRSKDVGRILKLPRIKTRGVFESAIVIQELKYSRDRPSKIVVIMKSSRMTQML